jgi:ubiquinol-cytochrome c reductase cytochrome b subunit
MSFGFTYMMIKLAKHSEANAKLQPKKGGKGAISLSQKWIYALFVALLAFQVYLNIAAYYAVLQGMKNYSLFIVGIIMLVFAGMFHLYRYGRALAKAPPPKPTAPPAAKPAPAVPKPAPAAPTAEKPLAAPPTATAGKVGAEKTPQLAQSQQKHSADGKTAVAAPETKPPTTNASLDSDKGPKAI